MLYDLVPDFNPLSWTKTHFVCYSTLFKNRCGIFQITLECLEKKMYVRTVDLKSDINVTLVIDNQLKLTPIDVEAR